MPTFQPGTYDIKHIDLHVFRSPPVQRRTRLNHRQHYCTKKVRSRYKTSSYKILKSKWHSITFID